MKVVGKIVDDDEIMLELYASGNPHYTDTAMGKDLLVGIQSLSYLVSDFHNKEIEIWVRVKR